jgi:hypothetical protein
VVTASVDPTLRDQQLQGEIELLASVMLGATGAAVHLSEGEVDSLLGVRPGTADLSTE